MLYRPVVYGNWEGHGMSSIIKKEPVDLSIIELIAVLKKETPKDVELKFDIGTTTVSVSYNDWIKILESAEEKLVRDKAREEDHIVEKSSYFKFLNMPPFYLRG